MTPNLKAHEFKPGQSGNPGGRPKGLGAYIREKTQDGTILVDDALKVLQSKRSSDNARTAARAFLAAYGFGKPVETQEVNETRRAINIVMELKPFLDSNKKEELAQFLSRIESEANMQGRYRR